MRESVVAWICDFLANREQSVKYRGIESHWLKVCSGAYRVHVWDPPSSSLSLGTFRFARRHSGLLRVTSF